MSATKTSRVPKRERKETILAFLEHHDLLLPPAVIYTNLREQGATFSERTTNRLLAEMVQEGLVKRSSVREGYYEITEAGREWLGSDG